MPSSGGFKNETSTLPFPTPVCGKIFLKIGFSLVLLVKLVHVQAQGTEAFPLLKVYCFLTISFVVTGSKMSDGREKSQTSTKPFVMF